MRIRLRKKLIERQNHGDFHEDYTRKHAQEADNQAASKPAELGEGMMRLLQTAVVDPNMEKKSSHQWHRKWARKKKVTVACPAVTQTRRKKDDVRKKTAACPAVNERDAVSLVKNRTAACPAGGQQQVITAKGKTDVLCDTDEGNWQLVSHKNTKNHRGAGERMSMKMIYFGQPSAETVVACPAAEPIPRGIGQYQAQKRAPISFGSLEDPIHCTKSVTDRRKGKGRSNLQWHTEEKQFPRYVACPTKPGNKNGSDDLQALATSPKERMARRRQAYEELQGANQAETGAAYPEKPGEDKEAAISTEEAALMPKRDRWKRRKPLMRLEAENEP